MNNEKKLVPKLRFPEFTHAWEQRKLGEAFVQTSEYINPQKHNVELWSLTVENGLTPKTERYQRDFLVKKEDSFKLIHTNEFVYNPMNMTLGAVGYNDMSYSVAISGYYVTMKTSHITDDLYMSVWLKTPQAISLYKENATGSLIEKQRVQFTTFSKIQFHLPSQQEQQKIGKFFTALDRYITIHQRKLENVKKLKAGLLQKMFPKNDQEFPEIRFPEFTYAWEQRKLRTLTKRIRGNDGRMDLPTLTMSASSGWLDQRERFSANIAGEEQKNYTLLKKGQLSYNHGNSKLAKYGVVFELTNYEEALVPKVYHSFETNEKANAGFLEYLFATKLPDRELGKLISSGARMDGLLNISYDDFMSIKVTIPKIQEQQKIGKFFTALDRYITIHQRKLGNMQKLKKSLLQQMFV